MMHLTLTNFKSACVHAPNSLVKANELCVLCPVSTLPDEKLQWPI